MIAEKSNLVKIFQAVKPGLDNKGIIEQFTHFIFTGNEVMTYNDEICISHPLVTDFQCSVSAVELYKTLTGIKGEASVTMELENDELKLKTARTEAGLSTKTKKHAEEMIELLQLNDLNDKWKPLPPGFTRGLFLCMFSASKDMTSGVATCVRIIGDKLLSSDEVRISKFTLKESTEMETLIPASSVKELINFDSINKYHLTDRWIHFQDDKGVIFSSRIMEGEYPEIEQYFDLEGTETVMPGSLKEEIESIIFMTEGKQDYDKKITVSVKGKEVKLQARKDIGWIKKIVEVEKDQGSFDFVINPVFFSQILEKSTTMTIGENAAKFVNEDFCHVLALPANRE